MTPWTRRLAFVLVAAPLAVPLSGSPPPDAHASPAGFSGLLWVLLLATFIGLGVITRVSRLLHTPLMSITNAISAIAVVGSIAITGNDHPPLITALGAVALFASMTNIVSGFLITDRMLKMFKTQKRETGRP
jgi:NAD(P) transhydrogenase subunit alpha